MGTKEGAGRPLSLGAVVAMRAGGERIRGCQDAMRLLRQMAPTDEGGNYDQYWVGMREFNYFGFHPRQFSRLFTCTEDGVYMKDLVRVTKLPMDRRLFRTTVCS